MGGLDISHIIFGFAITAFGIFMIAVGIWASYAYYRVIATGVHCKAKVVGKEIVSTFRGHNSYALMVKFDYYNKDLQKNQSLTKRYSSSSYTSQKRIDRQLGKEFNILYSEKRPDFVTSTSPWVNVKNYLQLLAIIVFCGIFPIILGMFTILG